MNPAVLVAAQEAGISEIYRVGGAQAIAALAYAISDHSRYASILPPAGSLRFHKLYEPSCRSYFTSGAVKAKRNRPRIFFLLDR